MENAKLLIADDDATTLAMLEASLQDRFAVQTATSGEAAVQQATDDAFDLVLLDVQMPDMDGYAACEAIKRQHPDIPVIFLSACITLDERLRGYQAGGDDYVTKPFDVTELTAKIERALAHRRRARELNGQIEEAMNTVLSTANLYGEVGQVLAFQREIATCDSFDALADVFFRTLEAMGFDGCLRLSGRQGVMSRTARAPCSALENSILDHVEARGGPSIQPVGPENTSYHYGSVLMLVRNLPQNPSPERMSMDEIDRLARARDNVALMAEGLLVRLRALDTETENSALHLQQRQVQMARETLVDISAQQHAIRMQLGQVLQDMHADVEASFIHLGLTETQEEHLSNTLRRYIRDAMAVFDQSQQIEAHLVGLIGQLDARH